MLRNCNKLWILIILNIIILSKIFIPLTIINKLILLFMKERMKSMINSMTGFGRERVLMEYIISVWKLKL